jgi:hypothetical protein
MLNATTLCERVDKWTHEPRSNLIITNTFPLLLFTSLILALIKYGNHKNTFPFAITLKTQKQLYFTALVYFLSLVFFSSYFILFVVLISKTCAWQPLGGVGDTRQGTYFAGCLTRIERDFLTVSWEFDNNPKSSLWGRFSCYNTLHLESHQMGTLAYCHQVRILLKNLFNLIHSPP